LHQDCAIPQIGKTALTLRRREESQQLEADADSLNMTENHISSGVKRRREAARGEDWGRRRREGGGSLALLLIKSADAPPHQLLSWTFFTDLQTGMISMALVLRTTFLSWTENAEPRPMQAPPPTLDLPIITLGTCYLAGS
jgi:hypothetical protein